MADKDKFYTFAYREKGNESYSLMCEDSGHIAVYRTEENAKIRAKQCIEANWLKKSKIEIIILDISPLIEKGTLKKFFTHDNALTGKKPFYVDK